VLRERENVAQEPSSFVFVSRVSQPLSLPRLCAHVSRAAGGSERGQTVAPPPSSLLQKRESGNCHLLTTFAETVVLPFGTPADGEGLSR